MPLASAPGPGPAGIGTTRRALLGAGLGSLALIAGARGGAVRAADQRYLVPCITGIHAATPPEHLAAATSAFLDRTIPVCLALDLAGGIEAPAFLAAAELARQEPGLIELAVTVDLPGEEGRYFQMRRAGELRQRVRALLLASQDTAASLPIVSVFVRGGAQGLDFPAYRSAGFLGLVAPDPALGRTTIGPLGLEQVGVSGGIGLAPAAGDDSAALIRTLRRDGDVLVGLSLDGAGEAGSVAQGFAAIARTLADETARGARFAARPIDLVQQLSGRPTASIALLLDAPRNAEEAEALAALAREFDRMGLRYSRLIAPDDPDGQGAVCTLIDGDDGDRRVPPRADCIRLERRATLAPDAPYRVVVTDDPPAGWSDLDADARLHIPAALGRAEWGLDPGIGTAPADRLILIRREDAATGIERIALARTLAALEAEGQAKLFTVTGFADHVMAPDTVVDRLQAARARSYSDPPETAPPAATERAALIEDARIAWRYIERLTDEETGLCAGAAQETQGGSLYASRQATLWDLASQMQGIIAAQDLEIITRADAGIRVAKLLDALPEQVIDGLRLPPHFVATDRRAVVTRGYDFCDTGRFLVALSSAVDAGILGAERAQGVFDGWDLAGTVRDGRPFQHVRGRWRDTFFNHCTPFLKRGLAPWGLEILSPYPDLPAKRALTGDDRMRLLYAAAHIGPYGAEPPLLEQTELGPSPATRCLAEVLFDAQLSHFERTGRLKCVSETSLNARPWFTYQGFRLDAPAGAGWVIEAPNPAARYSTDTFRASVEAVSSKAAYLWAAHYPHPYSRRLVEHVRASARIHGLGFSVGIFTETGEPMPGYSDINTNGIILGAIAYMLRKSG